MQGVRACVKVRLLLESTPEYLADGAHIGKPARCQAATGPRESQSQELLDEVPDVEGHRSGT
eukprot:2212080-Amphidinium_carterae.1